MIEPSSQDLPNHDLFGNSCAAGGTSLGSSRSSAHGSTPGRGAASAAVPFLVLPPLSRFRAARPPQGCNRAAEIPPPSSIARPIPSPELVEGSRDPAAGGTITFVPVRAMEQVLTLRHRQIHDHGHTLEADLELIDRTGQRHAIAKLARQSLSDAIEDMILNKDPNQIRRRLTKAAALTLAAMDADEAVAEAKAAAEQKHNEAVAEQQAAVAALHKETDHA